MSDVRPVIEESPEEKQKRKRRSYDVAFKMEVIEYAEAHNKTQAAKQYDIHRRCVQTWCKTREKLEAANSKRMRVTDEHRPVETVEVSISTVLGEISTALPITCANTANDDITTVGAAKTEEAVNASLPNDWDSTMVISVNRLQAEQILNKEGSPGSFLVRPSEKTPGDYALAFRTATEVRHWKIVQDSGKFYVHPRPNPYNSLEDIIQHFKEAVGQETGLVMTPLVHNWAQDIVQIPNVVIQNQVLTDSGDYDAMRPLATLPVSPTRSPTRTRGSSNKSTTIGRTSRPSASLSPLNPANLTSWSVDDVCQWLVQQSLGQFMEVFKENLVDGECLMVLDNSLLKEDLGITALGHRSRIMKRVKELKTSFEPPAS